MLGIKIIMIWLSDKEIDLENELKKNLTCHAMAFNE